MLKVVEFSLKMDGAARLVVVEEGLEFGPDRSSSRVVSGHHVEEIINKGGVQPYDDREIGLDPSRIGGVAGFGVDMGDEMESAEDDPEKSLPEVDSMSRVIGIKLLMFTL